jgi:hypothetical protein
MPIEEFEPLRFLGAPAAALEGKENRLHIPVCTPRGP